MGTRCSVQNTSSTNHHPLWASSEMDSPVSIQVLVNIYLFWWLTHIFDPRKKHTHIVKNSVGNLPTIKTQDFYTLHIFAELHHGHWAVRAAISSAAKGISLGPCGQTLELLLYYLQWTSICLSVFLPSNCRFCLSGISLLVALPLDSNILVEQKIIHQTFQVWRSVSPISKFIHQFQRTQKIIHQDIELFISDHHVWCPVRFLWAIFSLGLHTSARASRAQPWCVMPKNYGDKIHQRVLNICCICWYLLISVAYCIPLIHHNSSTNACAFGYGGYPLVGQVRGQKTRVTDHLATFTDLSYTQAIPQAFCL